MKKTQPTEDYFSDGFLCPNWLVSERVKACISTRLGGYSLPPYDSMNTALHVGDNELSVIKNRLELKKRLNLPSEPAWLEQVHGNKVVVAEQSHFPCQADATISFETDHICAVMVADCLPVLLCDQSGTRVGAAHAGWRGLATGILENTVAALDCDPIQLYAFLGPAIGPDAYQVGDTVRNTFLAQNDQYALCFLPDNCGAWRANLYRLAQLKLHSMGIRNISGGLRCTYHDHKHFFSYRRETTTGRIVALIYLSAHP